MNKVTYILLFFCFIACKHNDALKSESAEIENIMADVDDDFENILLSAETVSSNKFEELIELIKLKQTHPEFQSDINQQLLRFTQDSLSVMNYPKGFTITNIEQLGASKKLSDSLEVIVLGFTVSSEQGTFKDSVVTEIQNKIITIDDDNMLSKTIKFKTFGSN